MSQSLDMDNIPDTAGDPCHQTQQPREKHQMALHHYHERNKEKES